MQHFLLSGLAKYVNLKVVLATRIFRTLLLASGLLIVFSMQANAQDQVIKPVDLVIVESAPHMPWMLRTESTVNVFKGEKFNYDLKTNKTRLQKWIDTYPAEVATYRSAVESFFKSTDIQAVPVSEQGYYYDMRAQYQMLAEMLEWERFKSAN